MAKPTALTDEEVRAAEVFEIVRRLRGLTLAEVGRRTGMVRQSVMERANQQRRLTITDAQRFADVLEVSPAVFFMDPADAVRWVLEHAPVSAGEAGVAELPFLLTVVGSFVAALVGSRQPALGMWIAENQRDDTVMSGDDVASVSSIPLVDIWGLPSPAVQITTHVGAHTSRRMCSVHTHMSGPKVMVDAAERVGARRAGGVCPGACRPGERKPGVAGRAEGVAEVSP